MKIVNIEHFFSLYETQGDMKWISSLKCKVLFP
jgi:hypothetical protein